MYVTNLSDQENKPVRLFCFAKFKTVQDSLNASRRLIQESSNLSYRFSFAKFRRVEACQTASPSPNSGENSSLSDWNYFAEFKREFKPVRPFFLRLIRERLSDWNSFAEFRREFNSIRPLLLRLIQERVQACQTASPSLYSGESSSLSDPFSAA